MDYGYTGQPLDANGLAYHRARYYDASMGVWNSQDPLELMNRYGYVDGNPVMYRDPSGFYGEQPEQFARTCNDQVTDNCIYNCLIGNLYWLDMIGELENTNRTPTAEEYANILRSYSSFQRCIDESCGIIQVGSTSYLPPQLIPTVPTFADSEYPPRSPGCGDNAQQCLVSHLRFLSNTSTMQYLESLPISLDTIAERNKLFGAFVAPDRLWEQHHTEGTPADIKDIYIDEFATDTSSGFCIELYGQEYGPDVPGNIIYGYLARQAGFANTTALAAAGVAQLGDDEMNPNVELNIDWENIFTYYGDAPEDQIAVRMGLALYDRCPNSYECTDDDFISVLNEFRDEYVANASWCSP